MATTQTAEIASKLYAAEPTIVLGPSLSDSKFFPIIRDKKEIFPELNYINRLQYQMLFKLGYEPFAFFYNTITHLQLLTAQYLTYNGNSPSPSHLCSYDSDNCQTYLWSGWSWRKVLFSQIICCPIWSGIMILETFMEIQISYKM